MTENKATAGANPQYDKLLQEGGLAHLTAADKTLLKVAQHEHTGLGPKALRVSADVIDSVTAAVGAKPVDARHLASELTGVSNAMFAQHKVNTNNTAVGLYQGGDPMSLPMPRTPADVAKLSEISELTNGGIQPIAKKGKSL